MTTFRRILAEVSALLSRRCRLPESPTARGPPLVPAPVQPRRSAHGRQPGFGWSCMSRWDVGCRSARKRSRRSGRLRLQAQSAERSRNRSVRNVSGRKRASDDAPNTGSS